MRKSRNGGAPMSEAFKPVTVIAPEKNRLLFALRCVVDLQLLTIYQFLKKCLGQVSGRILDVGAGQAPWKGMLSGAAEYIGIDVHSSGDFGMERRRDVVLYDGISMPFRAAEFDNAMCIEVLEHVPDPTALLCEIARILKPGGHLFLTVPWAARIHHIPHDYHRFTRYRLKMLVNACGFDIESLTERGNDIATVCNKLLIIQIRLLRPKPRGLDLILRWPLGLILVPLTLTCLFVAHLSLAWHGGSTADPLGYAVIARKKLCFSHTVSFVERV